MIRQEHPGRSTSSPWPEKIEIASMKELDAHTIKVTGNIIPMSSIAMPQGSNAGKIPIELSVRDTSLTDRHQETFWFV